MQKKLAMSHIGKNIKKIRTVKKLSQSAFAELFNLTRASIGAYEEHRADPKIDTIINIANYLSISIDSLVTKELTINEIYNFDIFNEKFIKGEKKINHRNEIPFINFEKIPEFTKNFQDTDFIKELNKIVLPITNYKNQYAFEYKGGEMSYNNNGIFDSDIITAKIISDTKQNSLQVGLFYIFIYNGTLFFRLLSDIGKWLSFSCVRPHLEELQILSNEIQAIWQVTGKYTKYIDLPLPIETRISRIENQINNLQNKKKK